MASLLAYLRTIMSAVLLLCLLAAGATLSADSVEAQAARAQLSGTVVDAAGEPVQGVRAVLYESDERGRRGAWVETNLSNVAGQFGFEVLPGCYRVALVAPGQFVWGSNLNRFDRYNECLGATESVNGLDGTLHRADTIGSISGTVTRGGSSVEAGVKVLLYAESDGGGRGEFLRRTSTDGDGGFSFVVTPACYFVAFVAPGQTDTWSGTESRFTRTKACPNPGASESGIDADLSGSAAPILAITRGAVGSTVMDVGAIVGETSHGTRIYCPVSHFAYDDPVVRPGEPNASHLHMFWGNTGADAFSTGESLLNSGRSTCEGGLNNRSSYWMPAFFNSQDEVVLPDRLISYYKSFGVPDRSTIEPIPNGLQMLANQDIVGSGPWNFPVTTGTVAGQPAVALQVQFPTCLQVNGTGQPVLSSPDNISHLAYGTPGQPNACPTSHPYRIPGLIYIAHFAVDPASDWYLASDMGGPKGASLHADYIAAWDESVMDDLTRCNIEARDCDMAGGRSQLPQRFQAPDGAQVYLDSTTVAPQVDRTPFGATLTPMAS